MAKKKSQDTSNVSAPGKVAAPKSIGPYDIIRMMFTDIKGFQELSALTLERNAFMINRVFAIQFPQHAQFFNKTGINGAEVVKAWMLFAVKALGFGKVPSFVYTKGAKKSSMATASVKTVDKELRAKYCAHYNITLKDFQDMEMFTPNELYADVDLFKRITSSSDQAKQITKE